MNIKALHVCEYQCVIQTPFSFFLLIFEGFRKVYFHLRLFSGSVSFTPVQQHLANLRHLSQPDAFAAKR